MTGQQVLRIVVMGVSGSGKSTVAQALAARLDLPFIEGDDLHPPRNVALMAAGTPLTDEDRHGWLEALAHRLVAAADTGAVATCSALKRGYRDLLRERVPGLRWVYLAGEPALLAQRLRGRNGHYMPPSLLQSQLDTLEPPRPDETPITVTIALPPDRIVEQVCLALDAARRAAAPASRPEPISLQVAVQVTMQFTKIILETGPDGRARFRDEVVPLTEGKPAARLSALMPSGGLQLRMSPLGFRSDMHCTETPQWLFVLGGQMEIGLQGGLSRLFGPGDHFFSADTLPAGATFDAQVHGHWSRQVGPDPLITAFVRAA